MKNEKENATDAPEVIPNLKGLIEKGVITAITIDTTAFDDSGMRLDKGIFSQLRQFDGHPVAFLVSDVVLNEIRRHLTKSLISKKDRFSRDWIDACEFVGGDATEMIELKGKLEGMPCAKDLCEAHLASFLKESAAEIVEADRNVQVGTLLKLYFENGPPFHSENPKKDEFPDAIALLSLESWAEKNNKEIIVVSRDGDWESFCKESNRLHLVKDLATALALFQTPAEIVEGMLERLHAALIDKSSLIFKVLLRGMENFDWHGHILVEANSQFEYEVDQILAEITECNFLDDVESIKLTEINEDNISVAFNLDISGFVTVYCSFQKWDGIDKEYMNMGSGSPMTDFSIPVEIILNLPIKSGDLSDWQWEMEPGPLHVEFDDIEPDWMSGRE